MVTKARQGRWLLRTPPPDADMLLFCFPYAGVGASSYRRWPATVGGAAVCALQPPGKENRFREPAHHTHAEFAADLADFLADYQEQRFAFAAHCGAVPFALETILLLADRGMALPQRLLASSWGAPHRALYGPLNFVDLDDYDLVDEVTRLYGQLSEGAVDPQLAEIGASVLRHDLQVQRPYRYDARRKLPVPVTVIAWSGDVVVPPEQVPDRWDECAEVRHELLEGEHLSFLGCPENLQRLIERDIGQDDPARR